MIIKYPNIILLSKSADVSIKEGQEIAKQLNAEIKKLTWGQVVGLAAPQIGINKNVFSALGKIYMNPKITYYSDEKETKEEGCYSLKENKFDYKVERSKVIKIEWQDFKGKPRQKTCQDFEAQVLQHEYDHLLGKLCCKNMLLTFKNYAIQWCQR